MKNETMQKERLYLQCAVMQHQNLLQLQLL